VKTPEQIEQFFHEKIPLTKAMGVRVMAHDELGLRLRAPLDLNHNHLGTAFGGSLHALATLCGYGMLWLELAESDAHVVIAECTMSFRRPVSGDLLAFCPRPAGEDLARFKEKFERSGKGRIRLRVVIGDADPPPAEFEGVFVAMR
jgi:thioesterase domain-containing protein